MHTLVSGSARCCCMRGAQRSNAHSPQLDEAHLLRAGQWVCLAIAIQQPWLMAIVCCCAQQCWTVNTFNAGPTLVSFQFTADGNRQNSLQRLRSWTQLHLPAELSVYVTLLLYDDDCYYYYSTLTVISVSLTNNLCLCCRRAAIGNCYIG